MGEPLTPPLAELLEHLDGIGYRDLYLGETSAPRQTTAPEAAEQAAAKPAPTRQSPEQEKAPSQAADDTAPPTALQATEESPEERRAALEIVAQEASVCTACKLSQGRQKVVFGSGHANADLMLIGEGPGAEEDRQGLPFVGAAGELLTKILAAIDQDRSNVYIANVVKCRPPRNRDPEPDEVTACRGYLERQIDLIQPKVIVALGRVAAQALLGSTDPLGRLRGRWHTVRGVPTRATYHPAALLRYTKYKRPTWEDMQVVRDRLKELNA